MMVTAIQWFDIALETLWSDYGYKIFDMCRTNKKIDIIAII